MPIFSRQIVLVLLSSFIWISCNNNDEQLQQRANAVFEKAKDALARGDHQDGRRLLRETTTLNRALGKTDRLAEASLLLGQNYAAAARWDSALMFSQGARQFYRDLADSRGANAATLAIAHIHRICENYSDAERVLVEALRIEQARGDTQNVIELKRALVPVYRSLGDPEAESKTLRELLSLYVLRNDLAGISEAHCESGVSSLGRGKNSSGLQHFQTALTFANKSGNAMAQIRALNFAAIANEEAGNHTTALEFFSDAIRLADTAKGVVRVREEILLRVGNVLLLQKRFADAKKYYNLALRSAIRTQNRMNEAYALIQLGLCAETPNSESTRELNAGAELIRQLGAPSSNSYAQLCLARNAANVNRLTDALDYYRNAVACSDSSFSSHNEISVAYDCERAGGAGVLSGYDELIELLLQLGQTDEAFRVAQQRVSVRHYKMFRQFEIHLRDEKLNEALGALSEIHHRYIGAERQIENAAMHHSESLSLAAELKDVLKREASRFRDLADSIEVEVPQYAAVVSRKSLSPGEAMRLVPQGSGVAYYVPTSRSLTVFFLTPQSISLRVSAVEKELLHSTANEFIGLLERHAEGQAPRDASYRIHQLGASLYRMLVLPIERDIQTLNRVYVVLPPDFPLVPLHALQKSENRPEYLIGQLSVSYLTDVSSLALRGATSHSSPSVIAFGNAGATQWDVEYELSDTRTFSKDTRLYFGKEATLGVLRREHGDVLHMACDIRFFPDKPAVSFIALSGGREYASLRYERVGELFGVERFPIAFVSNLSNTVLHPIVPRILRMNGTSDVVMNSLLPSRKSKKYFVGSFYTNLLATSSAEVAYRNALIEMINNAEYAGPQNWAAFALW